MQVRMKFDHRWEKTGNACFVGKLFDSSGSVLKTPYDFFGLLAPEKNQVHQLLDNANGFWGAVIPSSESGIWILADRIRSFPIFYGQKENILYVSDDAVWVRENAELFNLNEQGVRELCLTAYVTGNETMYQGLLQVQAGEAVHCRQEETGQWSFESVRYYRYLHRTPVERTEEEALAEFNAVMNNIVDRTIAFADGRPVVMPLSGGHDCRQILLMLKEKKYDQIIAFTYGLEGNQESRVSREVAEYLGVPWYFVPYTSARWQTWWKSLDMSAYDRFAGGLSRLPHTQDWPAVMELRRNKIIPDDGVVITGYSADPWTGSYTKPYESMYYAETTLGQAIDESVHFHYSLSDLSRKEINSHWAEKRILDSLGDLKQYITAASLFESFNVAERQTKYINNALRVYEFWGLQWWTPFWDIEFLDFWSSAGLAEKYGQKLYLEHLRRKSRLFGLFPGDELRRNAVRIRRSEQHGKLLKKLYRLLPQWIQQRIRFVADFRQCPTIGILSLSDVLKYFIAGAAIPNGICASSYVKRACVEIPPDQMGVIG